MGYKDNLGKHPGSRPSPVLSECQVTLEVHNWKDNKVRHNRGLIQHGKVPSVCQLLPPQAKVGYKAQIGGVM